jgi:hypothetical protein
MSSHKGRAADDLWHNLSGAPADDVEIGRMISEIMSDRRWTGEQVATLSEIVFLVRLHDKGLPLVARAATPQGDVQ